MCLHNPAHHGVWTTDSAALSRGCVALNEGGRPVAARSVNDATARESRRLWRSLELSYALRGVLAEREKSSLERFVVFGSSG
jgi:hypothetical protein